jgi:hypothetical protein
VVLRSCRPHTHEGSRENVLYEIGAGAIDNPGKLGGFPHEIDGFNKWDFASHYTLGHRARPNKKQV